MERNVQRNKRLAQAYLEAVQSGDVEAIAGFYASDGVMCTTGNTLGSGVFDVAQIREAAAGAFAVFPSGMRFTVLGMTGEGERVAVEAESRATHVCGTPYHNQYHFLFRFRDGKIVEFKEYSDTELVTRVVFGGKSRLTTA